VSDTARGRFFLRTELAWETPYWGRMGWLSRPATTGAQHLLFAEVEFAPGGYHDFHYHPGQEEVLYVLEGHVEQWLDRERRVLEAGDGIFIPSGVVHGSFNVDDGRSRIIVAFAPCIGEEGYVPVEVGDQEPWRSLRAAGRTSATRQT
jgi:quercetin dioxygenase-like cupin family protein